MVLETSDGGVNWAFLTGGRYSQFFFLDTTNVWAIAQPSTGRRILKSTNGAQNFTTLLQTTVNTLKDIAVIDKDSLWVVGGGGPLYSNDGGRKWKRKGTGVSNPCYEVEFSEDGQKGWMTTTWLRIYRTVDGGDTWVRSQSLGSGIITERLYELDFINDQIGWVGSSYGTIYKTTNSGQSWQSVASGFLQTQLLEFAKPQIGWMTDANNTYKTIDGGANWNVDLAFDDSNLSALYFVDSLFGWAAGRDANQNTLLLHTNNTGNTWVKDTLPGIGPIKEVHFADRNKGWLITNNNEIWASEDGGQTWILEQTSLTHPIYALGAADSTHAWAVGDQSTIFRYQDCAIALPIINNTGGTLAVVGSYNSYQWLLNGDSILGATQATYTPNVAGIYTLIVHDAVDCHKTAFAFLVDNNVLSTTELWTSKEYATFKLYPNPSTGIITLEFEENIQPTELRIIHLSGQIVAVYTNLESQMELDCSQLPNGVYILETNGAKGKQVQKLILHR